MSNHYIIRVRESMMSLLLALITEFRYKSGFLLNHPLMLLSDCVMTTRFSMYLSFCLCSQGSNRVPIRLLVFN